MTASQGPPLCFVFNFCLLCSRRLPVSERNLPVPRPFLKQIFKICFEGQNQNLHKKSCRLKTWMEFVLQILMKLKTSSNEGLQMKVFSHSLMWLSKHCSGHYVTTQACTLNSWGCVHLWWCGLLEDYTLWGIILISRHHHGLLMTNYIFCQCIMWPFLHK